VQLKSSRDELRAVRREAELGLIGFVWVCFFGLELSRHGFGRGRGPSEVPQGSLAPASSASISYIIFPYLGMRFLYSFSSSYPHTYEYRTR